MISMSQNTEWLQCLYKQEIEMRWSPPKQKLEWWNPQLMNVVLIPSQGRRTADTLVPTHPLTHPWSCGCPFGDTWGILAPKLAVMQATAAFLEPPIMPESLLKIVGRIHNTSFCRWATWWSWMPIVDGLHTPWAILAPKLAVIWHP